MNTTNTDIEKFLIWFAQREEIPVKARRDFLAHIRNIRTIDQKAIDFIDETLLKIKQKYEHEYQEAKARLASISGALVGESIPQISLRESIITQAGEDMMQLAFDFKQDFRAYESEKNKTHEESQHKNEEAEVEVLKAKLASKS
jgi:hypothetical protein